MGRFSEAARETRLRRNNAARTEDADTERHENNRVRPDLARFLADDEPWDVGALAEMQYGPGARSW